MEFFRRSGRERAPDDLHRLTLKVDALEKGFEDLNKRLRQVWEEIEQLKETRLDAQGLRSRRRWTRFLNASTVIAILGLLGIISAVLALATGLISLK